jgi:hypothetical protein
MRSKERRLEREDRYQFILSTVDQSPKRESCEILGLEESTLQGVLVE